MNNWPAQLQLACEILARLDPQAYEARDDELTRGGLPGASIPNGSRSANKPHPQLDTTDTERVEQRELYRKGVAKIVKLSRMLESIENDTLLVMGVAFDREAYRAGDKDAKVARAKILMKANEALMDEMPGSSRRFTCGGAEGLVGCGKVYKRTSMQRPRSDRCWACWKWWKANGMPSGRTPQDIIDTRIETDARRKVG